MGIKGISRGEKLAGKGAQSSEELLLLSLSRPNSDAMISRPSLVDRPLSSESAVAQLVDESD